MSIKIYSMAEMQRLLREGGFPLEAPAINDPAFSGTATGSLASLALSNPVLSGTASGTYNIGGTPTVTQPIGFGGSGRLNLGGSIVDSPALQGDNDAAVLSDSNQTITSASAWDLVITPSTTRTLKWDNSFGLGASRRLTNADTTNVAILTANDDSEIGRLQPGETTTLKAISASPADDGDWSVLGPGAWTALVAYNSASETGQDYGGVGGEADYIYDSVFYDHNNEYDNTNGRFTPKQAGIYIVYAQMDISSYDGSGTGHLALQKNGSVLGEAKAIFYSVATTIVNSYSAQVTGVFELDGETDYIITRLNAGADDSISVQGGDKRDTSISAVRIK